MIPYKRKVIINAVKEELKHIGCSYCAIHYSYYMFRKNTYYMEVKFGGKSKYVPINEIDYAHTITDEVVNTILLEQL